MPRLRRFVGHWIALIAFGLLFPIIFYSLASILDDALNLPPLLPAPYHLFFAVTALAVGFFWALWAYSYLHFVGRGSPIEAFGVALYPTQRLVATGPYAYTRNPMVFGYLLVLLGIAFLIRSVSGLVLIPILALLVVLYLRTFEESGLQRRFGREYDEYREKVPVLIPKVRR